MEGLPRPYPVSSFQHETLPWRRSRQGMDLYQPQTQFSVEKSAGKERVAISGAAFVNPPPFLVSQL